MSRCTCRLPLVTRVDIDPPELIRDRTCPEHGDAPDPLEPYDRARDDAAHERLYGR